MLNRRQIGVSVMVLAGGVLSFWFFASSSRHPQSAQAHAVAPTCQASLVNLHPPYNFTLREASATPTSALLGPKPTSPKQSAVRVALIVACSGAPPQWWGHQGVGLSRFQLTDKSGNVTPLHEGYFGVSEPVRTGLVDCNIRYVLPTRIAGQDVSDINCILDTSDPHSGRYRSIPLAAVKVHLIPQAKNVPPLPAAI